MWNWCLRLGAFSVAFTLSAGVGYGVYRLSLLHPVALYERRVFQGRAEAALPPIGDPSTGRRSVYPEVLRLRAALGPMRQPTLLDCLIDVFELNLAPSPRENLVNVLHGFDLRDRLFRRIVALGYPVDYTPDSTWDLVMGQYSGGCRPRITATPRTEYWGCYTFYDDRVEVDVVYPSSGAIDPVMVLGHELGHASQTPANVIGKGVKAPEVKAYLRERYECDPAGDSVEIPQGLNDVCVIAEALRRFNGKDPDAVVDLADGYRPGLPWMRARAEEHGLFSGRPGTSMTELLASPSGLRWLKLLLERSEKPVAAP